MYAHKDKPKENKSRAAVKSVAQNKSDGAKRFALVDSRTESTIQRKQNLKESVSYSQNQEVVQRFYKKEIAKGEQKNFFTYHKSIGEGAAGEIFSAKLVPEVYKTMMKSGEEGLPYSDDELIAVKHVDGKPLAKEKIDEAENVPLEATLPGILSKKHRGRMKNEYAKIAPDTIGVLVVKDPEGKGEIREFYIMMELSTKGSIKSVTPKGLMKFDANFNANAKAYFHNLNEALITLRESGYTSGDIKEDNTLVLPTVDDGKVTTRVDGADEDVSAVLADFGDYKKGDYTNRISDLTNIMNRMFATTKVEKNFEEIIEWSNSNKLWQDKPEVAE